MVGRAGSEPESFGDALAGSGGMGDATYPSPLITVAFPDALSAAPLGGMPLSLPLAVPGAVAGNVLGMSRAVSQRRPAPAVRPLPIPPRKATPARGAAPARSAAPAPGQRPWSQFRPPAQPVQYMQPPTSAQLAPGSSTRPPAYLPPQQRLAQLRSSVTQVRAASARRTRAARPRGKKSSGAWGFVVFVIVLLATSGAGQKLISLITELFQRH
jgi:hypothetical protein